MFFDGRFFGPMYVGGPFRRVVIDTAAELREEIEFEVIVGVDEAREEQQTGEIYAFDVSVSAADVDLADADLNVAMCADVFIDGDAGAGKDHRFDLAQQSAKIAGTC